MTQHTTPEVTVPVQALVDVDLLVVLQGTMEIATRMRPEWLRLDSQQMDALAELGAIIDVANGKTSRVGDFVLQSEEMRVELPSEAVARLKQLATIISALNDGSTFDILANHLNVTRDAVRHALSYDGFLFVNGEVCQFTQFEPRGTQEERDAEMVMLHRLIDEIEGVKR